MKDQTSKTADGLAIQALRVAELADESDALKVAVAELYEATCMMVGAFSVIREDERLPVQHEAMAKAVKAMTAHRHLTGRPTPTPEHAHRPRSASQMNEDRDSRHYADGCKIWPVKLGLKTFYKACWEDGSLLTGDNDIPYYFETIDEAERALQKDGRALTLA